MAWYPVECKIQWNSQINAGAVIGNKTNSVHKLKKNTQQGKQLTTCRDVIDSLTFALGQGKHAVQTEMIQYNWSGLCSRRKQPESKLTCSTWKCKYLLPINL